jgi:LDH2 family malate/lactate/ureidoglycolate dehydrogenase
MRVASPPKEGRLTESRRVGIEALRGTLEALIGRLGFARTDAARVAGVLVEAELRGYADHGVQMLTHFVTWVRNGMVNPRGEITTVSEGDNTLLLDGGRACGVLSATRAMEWCIARARERRGIALAGIRNSSHFVAAGIYAEMAAEAGLIGFACSNAAPLVAPVGGRQRTLGTNPIAYGFPTARGVPVVFDVATSATAATKLYAAEAEGRPAPPNTVLDAEGRPSDDPSALKRGGTIAPLGAPLAAHKGFGLAMAVDALAGVLTGASFARGTAQGGWGQTLWAMDPEAFMPRSEFLARMDEQVGQIKGAEPRADVEEILVPGERARRHAERLRAAGSVPLGSASWTVLARVAGELGVDLPDEVSI